MKKLKTIENDLTYLRQISQSINLSKDNYKEYIKDLEKYCSNHQLFAISGIQLGIPKRIIYIKTAEENPYTKNQNNEKIIMINPIKKEELGLTNYWEGCASCQNNTCLVERPYQITISYLDENKKQQEKTYKGFKATIISHELDHLDGILHIDIAKQTKQLTKEERKKLREKFPYKIINKNSKYNHPKRKGEWIW